MHSTSLNSKTTSTQTKKRPTVGVAFGSGGVRGLAHVGVLKTLLDANIPIDYISGCSIGAWIGVHYASHMDIDLLEEVTLEYRWNKLSAFLEPSFRGGVIKGHKVETLLTQWLGTGNFEDLHIPVTVACTDLLTGKPVYIDSGPTVPAVRASMAIPLMFRPVEYRDYLLVDGALIHPLPDTVVRKMGADIVIGINLDNFILGPLLQKEALSLKNTGIRSMLIMQHYLAQYSVSDVDVLIEPRIDASGLNSWRRYFTETRAQHIVERGEEAAEKMIPQIQALLNAKGTKS